MKANSIPKLHGWNQENVQWWQQRGLDLVWKDWKVIVSPENKVLGYVMCSGTTRSLSLCRVCQKNYFFCITNPKMPQLYSWFHVHSKHFVAWFCNCLFDGSQGCPFAFFNLMPLPEVFNQFLWFLTIRWTRWELQFKILDIQKVDGIKRQPIKPEVCPSMG